MTVKMNGMSINEDGVMKAVFDQFLNRPETHTMLFDAFISDPAFQSILKRNENGLQSMDRIEKSRSNEQRLEHRSFNGMF